MTPLAMRHEALRILRDVSPDLRAAEQLLAQAEQEDERDRQLRRAQQELCEPELYAGCGCGAAE